MLWLLKQTGVCTRPKMPACLPRCSPRASLDCRNSPPGAIPASALPCPDDLQVNNMAVTGQRMLIIGATSAMAQHCARLWAEQGAAEFILVGRNASRMDPIVEDLKVRAPQAEFTVLEGEFISPQGVESIVDQAW